MKKRISSLYVLTFGIFLFVSGSAFAQDASQVGGKVVTGIATLYALDPLARTLCFGDGREGGVFQQNETRNRCSDIDFNTYNEGSLTVGIEGGRVGSIVDLGSATELEKRYGYSETAGKGQGFASLRVANGKVLVLKDRRTGSEQELAESALLFAESKKSASAPVKIGSIYLLRLTDRNDKSFERIVKLLVVGYTPNESVTIRWQVM